MNIVQNIGFKDSDFELLRQSLEALKHQTAEGTLGASLIGTMLKGQMPREERVKFEEEEKRIKDSMRKSALDQADKITELQYKLMQLRRLANDPITAAGAARDN